MENKISDEVAEQQLNELLDYYELESDCFIEKKQKNVFEMTCIRLKKAIRKGRLSISSVDDNIIIKQYLKKPPGEIKELEYEELSGKNKVVMGKYEEDDQHKKIYALIGSLTGLGESAIEKLKGVDSSICESLGFLFLQV